MGNRVNKSFQTENHFDDKLIQAIRNFDTKKKQSNINQEMMATWWLWLACRVNTVAQNKSRWL